MEGVAGMNKRVILDFRIFRHYRVVVHLNFLLFLSLKGPQKEKSCKGGTWKWGGRSVVSDLSMGLSF